MDRWPTSSCPIGSAGAFRCSAVPPSCWVWASTWLAATAVDDGETLAAEIRQALAQAGVPPVSGVLAPIGIILPMSVGALVMSVSTIVVALNAQLLRRLPLRAQPGPATGRAAATLVSARIEEEADDPRTRSIRLGPLIVPSPVLEALGKSAIWACWIGPDGRLLGRCLSFIVSASAGRSWTRTQKAPGVRGSHPSANASGRKVPRDGLSVDTRKESLEPRVGCD